MDFWDWIFVHLMMFTLLYDVRDKFLLGQTVSGYFNTGAVDKCTASHDEHLEKESRNHLHWVPRDVDDVAFEVLIGLFAMPLEGRLSLTDEGAHDSLEEELSNTSDQASEDELGSQTTP